MASLPRKYRELIAKLEPRMQAAFNEAVRDLVSGVQFARLIAALERRDIEAALAAVNIDRAVFMPVAEVARSTYTAAGVTTAESFRSGARAIVRFDGRNPRAEAKIGEMVTELSGRLTADTVTAARQSLTNGLAAGTNPRTVALDLVGRIDRVTGRRSGGVLGLTAQQEGYVSRARAALLSGDPDEMSYYLGLTRRNKRFDGRVRKAIEAGRAIGRKDVDTIIGKLSDSYLLLRGETVARTETLGALNLASAEAAEQMIEKSGVQRQNVMKVWRATNDGRTRESHVELNGDSVALDERFSNGMAYPHEPGAPASEVINCRCILDYRVDYLAGLT